MAADEERLPLINNNEFAKLPLDGTQPPTTYYSVWNIGTSIVIGAYAASIFFGENWTESTDNTMRMKIAHLLCALGINAALATRFSMTGLNEIYNDGTHVILNVKTNFPRAVTQFVLVGLQLTLAVFAAKPYTDMTNTLNWSTKDSFQLLKASYYIANLPMSYAGNGEILRATGKFLKTELARLLRMLPDSWLQTHRQAHLVNRVQTATIQATLLALNEAKRLALKEDKVIDVDRHQTVQAILADPRITAQPHLMKIAKQLLPLLLTTVTIYSFTGYMRSMATQSNSLFLILETIIALISMLGLSIISCNDLSHSLLSIIHDMIGHKIPLIHGATRTQSLLTALGLGGIGLGIYALAFLTAEASINLLNAMQPDLSHHYYAFIIGSTYAGTVIFNGTPANELTLNWLLHKARQRFGKQTNGVEHDVQRTIDAIKLAFEKDNLPTAYEICLGIQGDDNTLGNCDLFRAVISKQLGGQLTGDDISRLIAEDNHVALRSLKNTSLLGTSSRARWECFSRYILRAGGPIALTTWVIQPLMAGLSLVADPGSNTFIINTVSYLTFTVFMLIDMGIIPLPERTSPDTCLGRLALASKTLAPAIMGSAVKTAMLFTARASGLRVENEIEMLSDVTGAATATATAWSL